MKPHCSDPKFIEDLSEWCVNIIKREDYIRTTKQRLQQIEYEILWLEQKLENIQNKKSRKSKIREIENLKHQIREKEINYAFYLMDIKPEKI